MKRIIEDILLNLKSMEGWKERYEYIMELGEISPELNIAFRTDENRIKCNSKLYFYVAWLNDKCNIEIYSNGIIPRGLAALLRVVCNGSTKEEVKTNLPLFIQSFMSMGFAENITLQRLEAFNEMVKRINY